MFFACLVTAKPYVTNVKLVLDTLQQWDKENLLRGAEADDV